MTQDLERRWRARQSPFDGVTLFLADELVTITQVREALLVIIPAIAAMGPFEEFNDWHEHDGVNLVARPASIDSLTSACESDAALLRSVPGDDFVRRAIVDHRSTVLVRYYADVDEPDKSAALDITGTPTLIDAIGTSIRNATGLMIDIESAAAYFDRRYAG